MNWSVLRKKIFTTPNFITLFRFVVIFFLFWLWFTEELFDDEIGRIIVVVALYTIGVLSDYFDGYWARYYKVKSKVGAFLDSLVDKFFTISFFVAYLYIDLIQVSWVLVAVIIFREVTITGLRITATLKKLVMVTEKHGKMKMALQIVYQSIIWLYFIFYAITYENSGFQAHLVQTGYSGLSLLDTPFSAYSDFYQQVWGIPTLLVDLFWHLPNILLVGVTGFTLYSGISYILNSRHSQKA